MGAPFDIGSTLRPGTRFGPRAIRQAAGYPGGTPVEPMYHASMQVHPFQVLKVVDFGDANCSPHSIEQAHQAISERVAQILIRRRHALHSRRRSFHHPARQPPQWPTIGAAARWE